MRREANVIGPMVVKLRYRRSWTQDDLVAKLQLLGCYMTRDILANIETRRSIATDRQITFLAVVFRVSVADLFPPPDVRQPVNGRTVGITSPCLIRHRNRRETCPAKS